MILNRDNFPYLNSHLENGIEWKSNTLYFSLKDWNDYDYWFCEVFLAKCLENQSMIDLIGSEIFSKIQNDEKTFLVLCNSHEAFHDIVEVIYTKLVLIEKLPPRKIILMSESFDIDKEVVRVASKYNVEHINVEWTLLFEYVIKTDAYRNWHKISNNLASSRKHNFTKRYISLNRRWRPHRPMLVALLFCHNLLKDGYVSLMKDVEGRSWNNVYEWITFLHKDNLEISNFLQERKTDIFNLPDLFVDTANLNLNKANYEKEIDDFYFNSFLSIVSETNFYTYPNFNSARFLSEKTFKPIMFQHPFLLCSVPHSLDVLKFLGYQTFDPFINESYDLEKNDSMRMLKIVNEIQQLSLLSDEDLNSLSKELSPTVEYNFYHLIERDKHLYKKL